MITRTAPHSVSPDVNLLILVEAGPAHDLREHPGETNSAAPIFEAIRAAGHTVSPLHANAASVPPELRSIFVVTAASGPEFDQLDEQLRALPGVTATYLEFDDAYPPPARPRTVPRSGQRWTAARRLRRGGLTALDASRLAG
ncbi:hypothetical protein BST43_02445 [Mycobacteroides saopaulense]|uniref:Uncharacterized protein n=1 Tax=Mycobacteroides saopaulense TaxID=1578165 RepID=A0A1X0JBX1_9MYCO|nr:hypothetical protein [Mycobacteroides saopaulense]ORB60423.1 hypothetical protein BST43_02445 [Mycobacteroides saopaulense]